MSLLAKLLLLLVADVGFSILLVWLSIRRFFLAELISALVWFFEKRAAGRRAGNGRY